VAHLAAERGQWTLCVLGAAHSWLEWMPRGERVIVVSKIPSCGPCEVGNGVCPNGITCMENMDPAVVYLQFRAFQATFDSRLASAAKRWD
jgi:hypothetical protein